MDGGQARARRCSRPRAGCGMQRIESAKGLRHGVAMAAHVVGVAVQQAEAEHGAGEQEGQEHQGDRAARRAAKSWKRANRSLRCAGGGWKLRLPACTQPGPRCHAPAVTKGCSIAPRRNRQRRAISDTIAPSIVSQEGPKRGRNDYGTGPEDADMAGHGDDRPRTDRDRIIEIAIVLTDEALEVIAEAPVIAVHQTRQCSTAWTIGTATPTASPGSAPGCASTMSEPMPRHRCWPSCASTCPRAPRRCAATRCQDRRFLRAGCPSSRPGSTTATSTCPRLKELARRWRPEIYAG